VRNDLTTAQLCTITGPQLWPHLHRLDLGAILMVPLVADGTYLGHLSAARHGRGRPYTDEDVRMAADIAARVALAVRTATVVETLRSEREQYRQILETSWGTSTTRWAATPPSTRRRSHPATSWSNGRTTGQRQGPGDQADPLSRRERVHQGDHRRHLSAQHRQVHDPGQRDRSRRHPTCTSTRTAPTVSGSSKTTTRYYAHGGTTVAT
jgi:hypothetical protein